jgi:hypothetical protein
VGPILRPQAKHTGRSARERATITLLTFSINGAITHSFGRNQRFLVTSR